MPDGPWASLADAFALVSHWECRHDLQSARTMPCIVCALPHASRMPSATLSFRLAVGMMPCPVACTKKKSFPWKLSSMDARVLSFARQPSARLQASALGGCQPRNGPGTTGARPRRRTAGLAAKRGLNIPHSGICLLCKFSLHSADALRIGPRRRRMPGCPGCRACALCLQDSRLPARRP